MNPSPASPRVSCGSPKAKVFVKSITKCLRTRTDGARWRSSSWRWRDGRMIAYASLGGVWIAPAGGGAPKRLTSAAPGVGDPRRVSDYAPQWRPKGKWILFETGRRGHNNLMVVSEDGLSNNYLTD